MQHVSPSDGAQGVLLKIISIIIHSGDMIEKWQYELRTGSEKALKTVFTEYYTLLCSVAFQYVRDREVSQTIASDVLLAVWEKREIIFPMPHFRRYLLQMTRNKSIDYLRSVRTKAIGANVTLQECFVSDDDIFESYVSVELGKLIDEALGKLSPQCRKVFMMSRYENCTYSQIAGELGISENTVKYHIRTALAYLRNELSDYLSTILVFFCTIAKNY